VTDAQTDGQTSYYSTVGAVQTSRGNYKLTNVVTDTGHLKNHLHSPGRGNETGRDLLLS